LVPGHESIRHRAATGKIVRRKSWERSTTQDAVDALKFEGMLGPEESLLFFNLAHEVYSGGGQLVDAGSFLGKSASLLAAGLRGSRVPLRFTPGFFARGVSHLETRRQLASGRHFFHDTPEAEKNTIWPVAKANAVRGMSEYINDLRDCGFVIREHVEGLDPCWRSFCTSLLGWITQKQSEGCIDTKEVEGRFGPMAEMPDTLDKVAKTVASYPLVRAVKPR